MTTKTYSRDNFGCDSIPIDDCRSDDPRAHVRMQAANNAVMAAARSRPVDWPRLRGAILAYRVGAGQFISQGHTLTSFKSAARSLLVQTARALQMPVGDVLTAMLANDLAAYVEECREVCRRCGQELVWGTLQSDSPGGDVHTVSRCDCGVWF